MTTFRFVTNLRPGTVAAFEGSGYRPTSWLLSSHRLTPQTEGLAHAARDDGYELFADNGTKELIDTVIRRFSEDQRDLRREIQDLRRSLGSQRRMPTPSEVPTSLRERSAAAAREVERAVETELAAESLSSVLQRQLRMRPTSLIVKEDFTTPCLIALGLEREITGAPVSHFTRLARRSINWWQDASKDPSTRNIELFCTLPAIDYATARASATTAAEAGIRSVAVGFAGINLDSSFLEVTRLPRRSPLPGSAPRRYIRCTEVLLGIRDGYREAGVRLLRLHALGLGATAQYPVLAAATDWYTHLTVDATSPLHDAVNDLVFYDHHNLGDRIHVTGAADRVVSGADWPFDCPFCRYLRNRFGHSPGDARSWWASNGKPSITREHLHPSAELGAALPTFASARDGTTPVQARGRIGHNHWVCDQLAARVPSAQRRTWALNALDRLATTRHFTTAYGVLASRHILEIARP